MFSPSYVCEWNENEDENEVNTLGVDGYILTRDLKEIKTHRTLDLAWTSLTWSILNLELPQSLFQIKLVSSGQLCTSVCMAWLSPSAESLCYCSRDGTGTFIISMPFPYKQDSRLGGRRRWGIAGLLGLSLPVWNLSSTGNLVWRLLKPSILSLLCLE